MGICIYSIVFGPETLSLEFVMVLVSSAHFQAVQIEVLYTVALILTQLCWLYQAHAYGEHMPGPSPRREGNDEGGPWFSPIDLEFPSLLSMGISITPPRVGDTYDQCDMVYLNSGIPHQRLPRTLPRTNDSPFSQRMWCIVGLRIPSLAIGSTVLESSGHHDYVGVSAKPINLSLYSIMTSLSFQGHACGYMHMSVHACRLLVHMHTSLYMHVDYSYTCTRLYMHVDSLYPCTRLYMHVDYLYPCTCLYMHVDYLYVCSTSMWSTYMYYYLTCV